jgi:hypothetical protein
MRAATIFLALALDIKAPLAQTSPDLAEKLRSCSLLATQQRVECLDKLLQDTGESREHASSTMSAPLVADNWIVSETVSPIDYAPVAVATASSKSAPNGDRMQVSIQCRGGRTDIVLSSAALTRQAEDYRVFYRVGKGPMTALTAGSPSVGNGVAIRGDPVRLLQSLPDEGTVAFSVAIAAGPVLEGQYALPALKAVLNQLTSPCKWPTALERK